MKITIALEGHGTYTAEANPDTYRGVASSSKFKRQFGVPMSFMPVYSKVFDLTGEEGDEDRELNIDLDQLTPEQIRALPDPNEATAFLAWLELKRRCTDLPDDVKTLDWDDVLELLVDVEIDYGTENSEGGSGPTSAATTT